MAACRQGKGGTHSSYDGPIPPGAVERLGKGSLGALAFSPDGSHLAAGGDVGLYYYTANALQEEWLLSSSSPVTTLAFSPDGRLLAAALEDGSVALVDAVNGELLKSLVSTTAEETSVESLAWTSAVDDSGDQLLAAGYNNGYAIISRLSGEGDQAAPTGLEIREYGRLPRQASGVTAMAFSPNGRFLTTGNRTGVIDLWEAASSEWIGALEGYDRGFAVLSLAWSPDNRQILSGSRDKKVIVWDVLSFRPEYTLTKHQADAFGVAFAPDGLTFASASTDGEVILWDGDQPAEWLADEQIAGELGAIVWAPDLSSYAAVSGSGELAVWPLGEVETGQSPLVRLTGHVMTNSWVAGLAWSPDGRTIASAGADGRVVLTDVETDQGKTYAGHLGPVRDVTFSPDGARMASALRDKLVIIWNADPEASTQPLATLSGHSEGLNEVAWSPDGRLLASGSDDGTVVLWDVAPEGAE